MDRKKHHNLMMKIRKEFVVFLDLMLPLSYKPYLHISMHSDRNINFDSFSWSIVPQLTEQLQGRHYSLFFQSRCDKLISAAS